MVFWGRLGNWGRKMVSWKHSRATVIEEHVLPMVIAAHRLAN